MSSDSDTIQVRQDSPRNIAIRGICHSVGLREVRRREFDGEAGVIGIWNWTDRTIKAIEAMGKAWEYERPDIETIRRRIAYLADPRWLDDSVPRPEDDPPLWERTPFKSRDVDPRTQTTRLQSTYRPSVRERNHG